MFQRPRLRDRMPGGRVPLRQQVAHQAAPQIIEHTLGHQHVAGQLDHDIPERERRVAEAAELPADHVRRERVLAGGFERPRPDGHRLPAGVVARRHL